MQTEMHTNSSDADKAVAALKALQLQARAAQVLLGRSADRRTTLKSAQKQMAELRPYCSTVIQIAEALGKSVVDLTETEVRNAVSTSAVRACPECGCTETNACLVRGANEDIVGCSWVANDPRCSACVSPQERVSPAYES